MVCWGAKGFSLFRSISVNAPIAASVQPFVPWAQLRGKIAGLIICSVRIVEIVLIYAKKER
jgi:hypothetical protein